MSGICHFSTYYYLLLLDCPNDAERGPMRRRTTWSGRHCDHREHPWPEDGGVRAVMLNFRNWLIADSLGPCLDLILDRDQPWIIMSIGLRDWAQVGQTQ